MKARFCTWLLASSAALSTGCGSATAPQPDDADPPIAPPVIELPEEPSSTTPPASLLPPPSVTALDSAVAPPSRV